MDALSVERFVVGDGRIGCDVALAPHAPRTTTPALAAHVRAVFPDLPSHACVNGVGDTFGVVMEATPLPHMLEHLVIDLQTRAAPAGSRPDVAYVGVTRWTDESAGRAHIEVSFTDDLVALRAFRDAARFLNAAVVTCSP